MLCSLTNSSHLNAIDRLLGLVLPYPRLFSYYFHIISTQLLHKTLLQEHEWRSYQWDSWYLPSLLASVTDFLFPVCSACPTKALTDKNWHSVIRYGNCMNSRAEVVFIALSFIAAFTPWSVGSLLCCSICFKVAHNIGWVSLRLSL